MIFILKREVFNEIHKKYLKVKGRLPKHPITSITDLLTNRSTVQTPNVIPLNDVNQNRVPFPRESDLPLLIASPLPNESEDLERNLTNSPKPERKLENNESVPEPNTMRNRNEIPLQNQIQLTDQKESELVHRNSEPLIFLLPVSRELESAQRYSYP